MQNARISRRVVIHLASSAGAASLVLGPAGVCGAAANAVQSSPSTTQPNSLRDILAARDAKLLSKSFLNLPPKRQEYPEWLEGTWDITETFRGYEFPSKKIPKEKIISRTSLPGFTKLSIARFSDIGRQSTTRYKWKYSRDESSGVVRECFADNIIESIAAHSDGREVVEGVDAR